MGKGVSILESKNRIVSIQINSGGANSLSPLSMLGTK